MNKEHKCDKQDAERRIVYYPYCNEWSITGYDGWIYYCPLCGADLSKEVSGNVSNTR